MSFLDTIRDVLSQYSQADQAVKGRQVEDDFDGVYNKSPRSFVAEGIAEAFRSHQTPPFAKMVSELFAKSSGTQRAALLNTLVTAVGPQIIEQLGRGNLGQLLKDGASHFSSKAANDVTEEEVEQLAKASEKSDPSIVDRISEYYSENPELFRSVGAMALTVALAHLAKRQNII